MDLHGGTFHTMQCRATTTQENLLICFCYAQEISLFEIKMGLLFNIVTILFALSFLRVDFQQEDESYMAHNLKNESFSRTITRDMGEFLLLVCYWFVGVSWCFGSWQVLWCGFGGDA